MNISRIKTVRHGMYGTRPYNIWTGMKRRCYNKNEINYIKYGGKGIKMCDKWRDSFLGFWNDMKDNYNDNLQIDRIDNNQGYYKENCRWATLKEQANNKKSVKLYTHNGETLNASGWERKLGLKQGTIRMRIRAYGWDIERAITTPKKPLKGYSFDKNRNNYVVEMTIKGIRSYIGRFKTIKASKEARDKWLKINHNQNK